MIRLWWILLLLLSLNVFNLRDLRVIICVGTWHKVLLEVRRLRFFSIIFWLFKCLSSIRWRLQGTRSFRDPTIINFSLIPPFESSRYSLHNLAILKYGESSRFLVDTFLFELLFVVQAFLLQFVIPNFLFRVSEGHQELPLNLFFNLWNLSLFLSCLRLAFFENFRIKIFFVDFFIVFTISLIDGVIAWIQNYYGFVLSHGSKRVKWLYWAETWLILFPSEVFEEFSAKIFVRAED